QDVFGNYVPTAGPGLSPLSPGTLTAQQIQDIIRTVIGPIDASDLSGQAAVLRRILENGIPGQPRMVMGPNGQPVQVGGQALTQDRFRNMVSFGNWSPQQMGIEGLHDILQNQAMRAPLDQEILDVQRRGFMELIRSMGNMESIL